MSLDLIAHRRLLVWYQAARANALERLAYGGLKKSQYHYTTGYIKALDDGMQELSVTITELVGE